MTLIKSISGIRGTIGGAPGEGLTPLDTVKFASAYGTWLKSRAESDNIKVVIGRDARISGHMIRSLVVSTLQALGIDVIDLDLSTTPTVELAVPHFEANGGIILTASHNPSQWNALKLLNEKGEFISGDDGAKILEIAEKDAYSYATIDALGTYEEEHFLAEHTRKVMDLDLVKPEIIKTGQFRIVVDAVNSTGGLFIPALLRQLGVEDIIEIYCDPNGRFPHNPEPLPANLKDISKRVVETGADLGIVVDPDVDRLALVCEDGSMFGEEYTLVAVADYVLQHTPGPAVSNLSSSRALRDVAEKHGCEYHAAAVGEVNVVNKMKEVNAVIGGEGNGGVIYPASHYGRDALVGVGLFLTHLALSGMKASDMRASYPSYHISKNKIELTPDIDVDALLARMKEEFKDQPINDIDGVKIEFDKEWVHLRKSNTEPIIRIYTESENEEKAEELASMMMDRIKGVLA